LTRRSLDNAFMSFRLTRPCVSIRRQFGAVAMILLWITSAWAGSACCCDAVAFAAPGVPSATLLADRQSNPAADGHSHTHAAHADATRHFPHHPPKAAAGVDSPAHAAGSHSDHHSHTDGQAEDCEQVTAPHAPPVSKASAPPAARLAYDLVAFPATNFTLTFSSEASERRARWSLLPPPLLQLQPFLRTVRLLL
jgi:hypothetical protein